MEPGFFDNLRGNSLRVELVMALEEAFDIGIPREDVKSIRAVQHAIEYIRKRGKGRN